MRNIKNASAPITHKTIDSIHELKEVLRHFWNGKNSFAYDIFFVSHDNSVYSFDAVADNPIEFFRSLHTESSDAIEAWDTSCNYDPDSGIICDITGIDVTSSI